jgi:hypothetical protein
VGVSLIGIFLEWRLHAHGAALADAGGAGKVAAFHEAFALLAAITAAASLAAARMRPR